MTAAAKGTAITGSAARGQIGPALGLIDIGECEDSTYLEYIFLESEGMKENLVVKLKMTVKY